MKQTERYQKLLRLREELRSSFFERGELIDGALAALLSREHVLIIGPPGTAKSMLADELCRCIEGAGYFQWLLTKFTTPEELFGAVSLKGLEEDEYRRVTIHKLPEAHIAFLDEVFKANSSILNSLLTLMNERVFHNGRQRAEVPIISIFAASNELPEEDELAALSDRFLLRFCVQYIQEDFRFLKMLQSGHPERAVHLTLSELGLMQMEASKLAVTASALRALVELRQELTRKGFVASDRRYHQAVGLLKANAYLNGREGVEENDLFFLEHILWKDPAERPEIRGVLRNLLQGYEDDARGLLYQARELREYAERAWSSEELRSRAVVEAHTKIMFLLRKLDQILDEATAAGKSLQNLRLFREELEGLQKGMLETL
jgi:MoxR-like ATPase